MSTLSERIAAARSAALEDDHSGEEVATRPEDGVEIKGFFRKKDPEGSSWVGRAIAVEEDPKKKGFKRIKLDLSGIFQSIEWLGERGKGVPHGIKTWVLGEGLYKAKIVSKKGADPVYMAFAVVDGEREDLSEAELRHLLETSPVLPEEAEALQRELESAQ